MKKSIIFFFLLIFTSIHSQNKKILFSNEDLNTITEKEYKSNLSKIKFYEFKIENDSAIIYIKIPKEKTGKIPKRVHNSIKKQLSDSAHTKIDSSQTIIINYFPSEDKCIGQKNWNSSFLQKVKKYTKKLKKEKHIKQFFIFKEEKVVKNFNKKFKWYKDDTRLIENTFFRFHYPCFSYVVIKPNGNYYSIRGEYNITKILSNL